MSGEEMQKMVQNQLYRGLEFVFKNQEFFIQILKLMCPKNNETVHRKVEHSFEVQMAASV
jgi:hypothetical protein